VLAFQCRKFVLQIVNVFHLINQRLAVILSVQVYQSF
jgi:hypothetical protein